MRPSAAFDGTERFRIVRRLGHGSMGLVFEAFDRERGEAVALKSLIRLDPGAVYRFKREFRALADIVHPNLVALHELVAEGDHWFFTMELVPGEDFLAHVRPGTTAARPPTLSLVPGAPFPARAPAAREGGATGTLDVTRLRQALPQLALAVQALHDGGKVHRDLKPTNTLVTPAGRLVVLDFGIAQELRPPGHSLSLEEGLVGTVAYMAPEQAVTGAVTPASDWYSVGVMLHEALAGRLPFTGQLFQVLATKQAEDPPPVASLAPDAPADLAALCDALLARDPAARPAGEAVLRALGLEHASAAAIRPVASASVIGRERELAALQLAFDGTDEGRATVACVHGVSGIGKSTVVRHAAARWQRAGCALVLAGRCYERELVPYKTLDGVVEQLGRHLASLSAEQVATLLPPDVDALMRLFPSLRRVRALEAHRAGLPDDIDPLELRRRGVACLRELLRRLAAPRPVVFVVDDLHWGDAAGVAVLEELVRPPGAPRLLVLATFRSEEVPGHPFLRELLERCGTPGWVECPVAPLADDAVRALVAALGGEAGAEDGILREAAGSPFLVEQLVRYLQDGSGPTRATGVSLAEMVEARLAPLPPGSRALLELLAVAARPLDPHVAAEAAGVADAEAVTRMLLGARLVRSTGTPARLEPFHDRIRETIAAGVAADAARALHRRLAETLEAQGLDDPEPLYAHWLEAGDRARARRFAKAAGLKAYEALAFERAAALLQRALDLPSDDTLDRTEVHAALGDALASAGRGAEAARAYLAAVPGTAPALQLEYRRRAAEQLLISGHLEEGLAVVREVLAAVGLTLSRSPRRALASLLWRRARLRLRGLDFRERDRAAIPAAVITRIDICWAVAVGLGLVDNIRAADFQSLHLLLALDAGEPERVARALAVEAGFVATQGAPKRAKTEALLAAAEALAGRLGSSHAEALAALIRGIMHYHEGDWARARDLAQEAERRLLRHGRGVAWELSTAQLYQSYACFFLGDLPELVERVGRFRRLARERGNRFATFIFQSGFGNLSWLIADEPDAAGRAIEEARAEWQQEGFGIPHYLDMVARAHRALYVGETWPAWEVVAREWRGLDGSFLLRIQGIRVNALNLRARCALAQAAVAMQPGRYLESAERDAHRILRERMPWSDGLAWSVLGLAAAARGDRALGRERLARSGQLFERAGMRLHATVARWRAGQVGGGPSGDAAADEARAWLTGVGVVAPDRLARVILPEPAASR